MNIISTRVHGALDYLMGLVLVAVPYLLAFPEGAASNIPIALGVAAFLYSVLTNYELGMIRVLPFRIHLLLDIASGLLLAASPWLFGFAADVWMPHVILGGTEVLAALLTDAQPFRGRSTRTVR